MLTKKVGANPPPKNRTPVNILLASAILVILLSAIPAPASSQSVVGVQMRVSPTEAAMTQGITTPTQIATVSINLVFYAGPEPLTVTLSSSGQPSTMGIQFDPNPMPVSGGTVSSSMKATTGSTPVGDYLLTITATLSNGAQDSKQFLVKVVATRACVIATAAYGSELAPPVQFLRNFRDQTIMNTFAGSQFMAAFNAWYYSFSPGVADFISGSSPLKALTRAFMYPLVGILQLASVVYSLSSFNPELGVVLSGTVASALIGAVYTGLPFVPVLSYLRKKGRLNLGQRHVKPLGALSLIAASAVSYAELTGSELLMVISSVTYVLAVMFSAGLLSAMLLTAPAFRKIGRVGQYVRGHTACFPVQSS